MSNLHDLRWSCLICALAIAITTLIASATELVFVSTIRDPHFVWLTAYLFRTQDMLWLMVIAAFLFGLAIAPLPHMPSCALPLTAFIVILTIGIFAAGLIGTYAVFDTYHLSRDELLAEFDARIFQTGKLIAPIESEWQPFASALAPRFMLPVPHGVGFVSSYLPVNAGFRAIMGWLGNSNLTSPFLAALSVLATFGAARRLWPERADAAIISTLLVATSSQVLITSMTSYAMTAHLALNMMWLWCFLRDDKKSHGAAIAIGFLASGLHQLIFHPMFVAPFIAGLWFKGRRSLAVVYIASYALISVFWISFWKLALDWHGVAPEISDNTGPLKFVVEIYFLLSNFRWEGLDLMSKNILRFVAWQSPAMLPLALFAYPAIRRNKGPSRELIAGILLTLIAMFILLPYQGHGWGYRYLHGVIGSLALLGGYGWIAISDRFSSEDNGRNRAIFATCTAFAVLVLLPVHAKQAHEFVQPYAMAEKAIEQAPFDAVIVDKSNLLFAEDLVRNDPFLRNRPKVFDLTNLGETSSRYLCAHASVGLFDAPQAMALGITPNEDATRGDDNVRAKARTFLTEIGCATTQAVPVHPRP